VRRLTRTLTALLTVGALLALAPAALARTSALTGVVQLQHADARTVGAPAQYSYSLRTTHGLYRLRLAGPSSLTPGSYVRVTGTRRGSLMRVRSVRRVKPASAATRRLAARANLLAAPAAPKLAVILINFSDDPSTPWSPTAIANTLFNNPDGVAAYYAEQSFGKTMLTGTVFGWYTIAATNNVCDYATWANQADAAAGNAISGYTNVMYVFPFASSCGWAGLGAMPGPVTWINGDPDLRVMAHELGHNFGVHHASSFQCTVGGSRVALAADASCSWDEYGDPFSIMGASSTRQFPAFHKGELGWLRPTSTYTVTSTGTYTIAASELDTAATQLLRIPRTGSALYIDVRQPFGSYFDNFLPGSGPVSGVMLRRGPSAYNQTRPALIDATPATATFADAALAVGQSLTDPVSGVTITTDAITAGGATVTITVPGAGTAPSAPGNVSAHAAAGGVDVTWTAATDDVGVSSYQVYRNGSQIGTTAGLAFHDTVANGVLSYTVAAVDGGGLVGPAGAAPDVSIGDVAAPSVPTVLAATVAGATINLSWAASTDNVGVTGYRVYRGSSLLTTTTSRFATDTTARGGNSYVYSVRAYDAAANLSGYSAPLVVTLSDGTPPSAITGLRVAVHPKPWGATLTWGRATDDVAVTGYRIYRDARLVVTVTGLTYTDPGLPRVDMAVYAVAAIDATANEGERSRISAIPPDVDLIAPAAPRSLRGKALTKRRVRLTWPAAVDDVGVVRYEIVVGGRTVLKTAKRTVTIRLAGKRGKRISISVRAVDAAGNRSRFVKVAVRLR
jgi:fibronectin type 3 domain-containing protein